MFNQIVQASALCDEEENDFLNDLILSVLKNEG